MVIDDLISKTIFLDTAPLIYYIEGNSAYEVQLDKLFELNKKGEIFFSTSTITLLEILVKPLREKRFELAKIYSDLLIQSDNFKIIDIDRFVAIEAANLRSKFSLKTPDSIQIAASSLHCDFFLTNDKRLQVDSYSEKIILLSDLIA